MERRFLVYFWETRQLDLALAARNLLSLIACDLLLRRRSRRLISQLLVVALGGHILGLQRRVLLELSLLWLVVSILLPILLAYHQERLRHVDVLVNADSLSRALIGGLGVDARHYLLLEVLLICGLVLGQEVSLLLIVLQVQLLVNVLVGLW